MLKFRFTFLMLFLALTSIVFANTTNDADPVFKTLTFKELKATYGAENVSVKESLNLKDTDMVLVMVNPCNGEMPCNGAIAKARQQAQRLANECCCVRFFGVVCCDPNTGSLIAVDGIALPNKC